MSTIQQLKNFIRHGKQARGGNGDEQHRVKQESSSSQHDQQLQPSDHNQAATDISEPVIAQQGHGQRQDVPDAFSDPSGNAKNRATQAEHTAAHRVEADQTLPKSTKNKKLDDESIARLVAEENASRNQFPRYPGLERWELLEKMGDGAFSNVYRARDLEGGAGEVAIKVVRKFEMNNQQRANILKEVQIMRQLDHPNIIKLIDFSESRQYYYIVLELAPGGELFHQIVRLTYFSEELSRHVITQVASALEYLHEQKGVVHRDIKPENILFDPIPFVPSKHPKPKQPGDEDKVDEGEFIPNVGSGGIGRIKIADFGLSKVVWDNQTMTPCGTVGYTAPEIVKDERYSKSVDMWALGCVLYTLLCGFPPFYDESIEVLTEKVAKGQYTFLSPWWDDISSSAKDLISHLLTVDPEKRFTIKEFLNHPWIRKAEPTPPRDDRKAVGPDGVLRAFDASKIVDGEKRYDFRSPAAVNLREVFDVGYAVHRQEEEDKIRRQIGAKAGGGTPSRLAELSEADEEEESGIERGMRKTKIRDSQEQQRGRERERHEPRGYGQHSAAVAAAARQQVRDRHKQKGAFELNIDNASILGRRAARVV
ncbi:hypothetical protein VTK73DRAFT_8052 [Phialemonium thermophilum]|uniref:Protein kinase domain-containing protein n=1 Tax=Phialemonium thermophilum TaxID=223376 RepID=A0ABR3XQ13_9PEZI